VLGLGASLGRLGSALLASPDDNAVFEANVPLSRPRATPLERRLGGGLDARLFTDLSQLRPHSLVIPADRFYIRTSAPAATAAIKQWTVSARANGALLRAWTATELRAQSRDAGVCLLECSGNSDPDNFGLISAARWQGVPVHALLEPLRPRARRLITIAGLDDERSASGTSIPGASWTFTWDQLRDAFLATGMNGAPLPPDHGYPVRLVVPGWYGCTCIKWVTEISFVDDDAAATIQMREFAARTHQASGVALAREYLPATIDHAAIPVRIERWRRKDGTLEHRVIGIVWGGSRPTNALEIQFLADGPYEPVSDCPLPTTTRTWSLWSHTWQPASPGRYSIALRVADRSLPTRRLDMGFYRRAVSIDRV
jgi:DMSO/TMAO reductase YedYZ molybdopterin-dependent catalytic subunit